MCSCICTCAHIIACICEVPQTTAGWWPYYKQPGGKKPPSSHKQTLMVTGLLVAKVLQDTMPCHELHPLEDRSWDI